MPVDPLRGKLWEPKNHEETLITREMAMRFADTSVPLKERTWGLHFFPIDLGVRPDPEMEKAPVRIEFFSPEDFGLDEEKIKAAGDVSVICAKVGPVGQPPMTTFMHVCRKTDAGMELRSRFWYGWDIKNGQAVHAGVILPEVPMRNTCQSQNIHLIEEYYNLAQILPKLYESYKDVPDDVLDYI